MPAKMAGESQRLRRVKVSNMANRQKVFGSILEAMVMVWGCMVVAPFRMGINFLWPDAAGLFYMVA